ncbi:MAG: NAD-dependent epimerase/dehydratase family protein [Planctomycetia bacterium]|nr:NAD-dependent epimerase/dehydratase family protein [Planctomycetia bacterium]
MNTVRISGATGFIGRHLTAYLASQGHIVHAANRRITGTFEHEHVWDASLPRSIAAVIEQVHPNIVIHLASRAKPGRDLRNLADQYDDTIKPALAVVQAVPESVELAVFFGSCEEYGDGPSPAREEQPLRSVSAYGWAKISAFHGVTMIASQRKMPWCWARPYLVFGPAQSPDRMISEVICKCLRGEDVPLSPGQQTRDLVYVDDLCRMVARLIEEPARAAGQVINLCTGRPTKVADAAALIQRLVGRGSLKIGALPYRSREYMDFYGSPERFNSLFGEITRTSLESAMVATIDAYRAELASQPQ